MRYDLHKEIFDFLPQSVRKTDIDCRHGLWTQCPLVIKYWIITEVHNDDEKITASLNIYLDSAKSSKERITFNTGSFTKAKK